MRLRVPAQGGEVVAMSPDRGGGGRVGSLYWRGQVFSSRRIAKHEKHRKSVKWMVIWEKIASSAHVVNRNSLFYLGFRTWSGITSSNVELT